MPMHHRSVLKLSFFLNNTLLDKAVEGSILVCISFFEVSQVFCPGFALVLVFDKTSYFLNISC